MLCDCSGFSPGSEEIKHTELYTTYLQTSDNKAMQIKLIDDRLVRPTWLNSLDVCNVPFDFAK